MKKQFILLIAVLSAGVANAGYLEFGTSNAWLQTTAGENILLNNAAPYDLYIMLYKLDASGSQWTENEIRNELLDDSFVIHDKTHIGPPADATGYCIASNISMGLDYELCGLLFLAADPATTEFLYFYLGTTFRLEEVSNGGAEWNSDTENLTAIQNIAEGTPWHPVNVPEPAAVLMIGAGALLISLYRKFFGRGE